MQEETKKLFFGFSIEAPWPDSFPKGRTLEEASRHVTLAFLGNPPFERVEPLLQAVPQPSFALAPTGILDSLMFLPKDHSRVVAYHLDWRTCEREVQAFHSLLKDFVRNAGFNIDPRPFNAHITIARKPFKKEEWERHFSPLPFIATGFHLFESVGNLTYHPLWSQTFSLPFEEIEHTADIAFQLKATNLEQMFLHACIALSFHFPPFCSYMKEQKVRSVNEIVEQLNAMVTASDMEIGCPFKAVSHHGEIEEENGLLHWEMIVDV